MKTSFFLAVLFLSFNTYAQYYPEEDFCGFDKALEIALKDAEYKKQYENQRKSFIRKQTEANPHEKSTSVLQTIPVVVHIIHAGEDIGTNENPAYSTIEDVIEDASDHFRHMHSGAGSYANPNYGADTEIEICLAKKDPSGNYTNGVLRHYNPAMTIGAWSGTTYVADLATMYAWDKTKYCNLFIVKGLYQNSSGCGVTAGLYFPGPAADITLYQADAFWWGLVMHELGHYFSLLHPFQGACTNNNCLTDGDGICDTPPVSSASAGLTMGGTCNSPYNSCTTDEDDTSANNPYRPVANGGMGDQVDNVENYMDYTAGCWDTYTEDQKSAMQNNISVFRSALANNGNCTNTTPANDASISAVTTNQINHCDKDFDVTATIKNEGTATLTSATILIRNTLGNTIASANWSGSLAQGASSTEVIAVTIGLNDSYIKVESSNPNGSSDGNPSDNGFYKPVSFIGGTSCNNYSACQTLNPNTINGPGNTTVVSVNAAFPSAAPGSQIEICCKVDPATNVRYQMDIKDENGTDRGDTCFKTQNSCGFGPEVCFYASVSEYNSWKADGTITVTFDPKFSCLPASTPCTDQCCVEINIGQGSGCISDLDVTQDPIPDGTYEASNLVESSSTVPANGDVIFAAGNTVELNPEFETVLGAIFTALIQGCF